MRQDTLAFSPQAREPVLCNGGRRLHLLDILRNCGGLQRHDGSLLCAAASRAVISDDNLRIEGVMGGYTAGRVTEDVTRRSDANGNLSAHVDKNIGAIAKALRALQWCCVWPRSFIAGLAATISVYSGACAAAESCLSADISLSNWQEKEAGQIDQPAGSARCWQSKSNSSLGMCLERVGEPKECRLAIRFHGKGSDFPVDETHGVLFTERKNVENREFAFCNSESTYINTEISVSKEASVTIQESLDLPVDQRCINSAGELLNVKSVYTIFLGNYSVNIQFFEYDKSFSLDQLEKVK